MQFKVTRLKIQKPRKGELWMRGSQSHGTSSGVQTVRSGDGDHSLTTKGRSQTSGDTTVGNGFTLNPVGGIGKEMVRNLDRVKSRARAQYIADRKAFVKEGCATF